MSESHAGTRQRTVRNPLIRHMLIALGCLSVALGVAGIFLPVLPTTPFLLLAAACFVRTSPTFYQWLVDHPRLGRYLVYYLDGQGMPLKAKFYTLALMWSMLLLTAFVILERPMLHYILPLIGAGVSIYILRLPTLKLSTDVVSEPGSDSNSDRKPEPSSKQQKS